MNKAAMVDALAAKLGGSKADAERAFNGVFDIITDAMKSGDEASVAGFGIFSAKQRAARTARNPRTGEPIQVPAMKVPKFKASKTLKDTIKAS